MIVESIKTKASESSGTTAQTKISEIVSGRITNRKLDENNYLQWKWVIEIYVASHRKTSQLLADHLTPVTNA